MRKIISIWPTLADLARDLGLPYTTVASWPQRMGIPARYDLDVIKAARARGADLSFEDLTLARAEHIASKQGRADDAPEVAAE